MKSEARDRRDAWRPEPRPEWVARLNEEGDVLNMRSVVPLDESSLLAEATRNTGLGDFGDDQWLGHFRALLTAIESEANLNFMGRMLTRAEFILYLEARLRIQDYFRRFPEIEAEAIEAPVMLLGHDRTGTNLLHETLACDPQFRVVKCWEALFPAPPPEESTYRSDPRIQRAERFITIFDRITPEWQSVQKYGAELPVECSEYLYASFLSKAFLSEFQVPSYANYLEEQDPRYTLLWHRRVLKFLQWKFKKKHWLLKNPIWIETIPQVLSVYPDAKIVLAHRDPIVAADSSADAMGNLFWWRTDDPWGGGLPDDGAVPGQRSRTQDRLVEWMENGTLRPGFVANVRYQDLIRNPAETLRALYQDLGLTLTEPALALMSASLEGRPKGKLGRFKYQSPDPAALANERRIFERYQAYFNVPNEI